MDVLIPPITDLAPTRDGGTLHFGEWPGSEPTLVAVHGLANHHRNFAGVAAALEGELRVVAPDLAGRGLSPWPAHGTRGMEGHARDVLDLMDHVGVERGLLAGHSMGAYVVTLVAAQAPERVSGLVLVDGGAPPAGSAADTEAVIAAVEARVATLTEIYPSPAAFMDATRSQPSYADTLDEVQHSNTMYSLGRVATGYRRKVDANAVREDMLAAFDAPDRLAAVSCPVLAIGAEEGLDPGTPPLLGEPEFALLHEVVGDVTTATVAGTNHQTITISRHGAQGCAGLIREFAGRVAG